MLFRIAVVCCALVCSAVSTQAESPAAPDSAPATGETAKPWDQTFDIQYGEAKGQKLLLDVLVPNGKETLALYTPNKNGAGKGIIDVISGGWNSERGRQDEHEDAKQYHILCGRGYTVFAIRCGSEPDFTALEMAENIHRGIRWVKQHAREYNVDPERLGLTGASAGGHLASLVALNPKPAEPQAEDPLLRHSSAVKAVGIFFPPTDFLNWEGKMAAIESHPTLAFSDGIEGKSEEEIRAGLAAISPARQVKPGAPPFYITHGDLDFAVPLQQSQIFVEALKAQNVEAELHIKKGGGHVWITIPYDIMKMTDWFDKKL